MINIYASLPPMTDTELNGVKEILPKFQKVDGFILNDNGWGVSNILLASILIEEFGKEAIPHLILRDKNRIALKGDLCSCEALKLGGVILSTGRHSSLTLFPDAKPVYDFDLRQAIKFVKDESGLRIGAELFLGSDYQWEFARALTCEDLDFLKVGMETWSNGSENMKSHIR